MKLTVLVDNNVYIDHYYYGEPALSFFVEDGEETILFDTGYSHVFFENAKKLGIDLTRSQKLVLSHGHNDHTGGLVHIDSLFPQQKPEIIAHPLTFFPKRAEEGAIGSPESAEKLQRNYPLTLSKEPLAVSKNITFLGEIPQMVDFEPRQQVGETKITDTYIADYVLDDSALVFQGTDGIYIITGCSHSGICNICEYAKQVTGIDKINGVIGGFHLFEENEQLEKTIRYLKENNIPELFPCHCVSFAAKSAIHQAIPIGEVGVGMTVEWD